MAHKELVSEHTHAHTPLKHDSKTKTKNLIKTWAKDLNRHLNKEDYVKVK